MRLTQQQAGRVVAACIALPGAPTSQWQHSCLHSRALPLTPVATPAHTHQRWCTSSACSRRSRRRGEALAEAEQGVTPSPPSCARPRPRECSHSPTQCCTACAGCLRKSGPRVGRLPRCRVPHAAALRQHRVRTHGRVAHEGAACNWRRHASCRLALRCTHARWHQVQQPAGRTAHGEGGPHRGVPRRAPRVCRPAQRHVHGEQLVERGGYEEGVSLGSRACLRRERNQGLRPVCHLDVARGPGACLARGGRQRLSRPERHADSLRHVRAGRFTVTPSLTPRALLRVRRRPDLRGYQRGRVPGGVCGADGAVLVRGRCCELRNRQRGAEHRSCEVYRPAQVPRGGAGRVNASP